MNNDGDQSARVQGPRPATARRLAVSNIAWPAGEDDVVFRVLREEGVDAVEIAPTRVVANPADASVEEAAEVLRGFRGAGLEIIAVQSLLYARPDAQLFGTVAAQRVFSEHLLAIIRLAGRLGARRLVLGSPANRRRGDSISQDEAVGRAVDVLGPLASAARDVGAVLCIEPNPPSYGCDFVTTPDEGAALVEAVGHTGFGLHLDTAGSVLAGVDPAAAVAHHGQALQHVHVSAPDLGEIEQEVVPHAQIGAALAEADYRQALSIEMRPGDASTAADRVRRAIRLTRAAYGL